MDFINLTNCREHPSDSRYIVFIVKNKEQAVFFEEQLVTHQISFEKHDENGGKIFYAVHKKDESKARHLNNLAIGKYRNSFIPQKGFRIAIIAVTLLCLLLAIVGYIFENV